MACGLKNVYLCENTLSITSYAEAKERSESYIEARPLLTLYFD